LAAASTSLAAAGVLLAARRRGRELRKLTESASRVGLESYQELADSVPQAEVVNIDETGLDGQGIPSLLPAKKVKNRAV